MHVKRILGAAVLATAAPAAASATDATIDPGRETIRIAFDAGYPPFIVEDADGTFSGFEVDLVEAWCARMTATCTQSAHTFDTIIPALNAGKFDAIVASMYITEERAEKVAFTRPYYFMPGRYATREDADFEITREGLRGKVIGVQRATTEARHIQNAFGDVADIRYYDYQEPIFMDAGAGRLDLILSLRTVLEQGFLDTPEGADWHVTGPTIDDPAIYGGGAAVAVRHEDDQLREAFNQAIEAVIADGTYERLKDKYFDFDFPVRPPEG